MADVVDLRGLRPSPAVAPVLADPSGKRARVLARAGRLIAAVFLVWLAGLALAGLGILPTGVIPLGHEIDNQSPPALKRIPLAAKPNRADLTPASPARPAAAAAAVAARRSANSIVSRSAASLAPPVLATHPGSRRGNPVGSHGGTRSTTSKPPTATTPSRSQPTNAGPSTTASGKGTTTAPGQTIRQSTPGHTKPTTPGKSAAAPGQVKQTTSTTTTTPSVTPGQSGSAPGQTGQTGTQGAGHGHHN